MQNKNFKNVISQTDSEQQVLERRGYHISDKLGQGGYGKVYLTEYFSPGHNFLCKLACKLVDTTYLTTHYIQTFLKNELKIISQLNHPNIILIHSIVQRTEKIYIFMRYAEKGDLLDYIVQHGPLKEKHAKIWTRQLALAIQYLHILDIAHRDIKCENILITHHYNIKLTDFGFSRFCADYNDKYIFSTTYCGSISYSAPQIINGDPYNPKAADMWSFGCVLYVMLNKTTPFDAENHKQMYDNQFKKNFHFRTKYKLYYTNEIKDLVNRLLEPNEDLRYKIEHVLNANWISPELKVLNKQEYQALVGAMDMTKNRFAIDFKPLIDFVEASKTKNNDDKKQLDKPFDLTLVSSNSLLPPQLTA